MRDGDDIYAQILGTAVSQDGHTDGITVPSAEAQEAAINNSTATSRHSPQRRRICRGARHRDTCRRPSRVPGSRQCARLPTPGYKTAADRIGQNQHRPPRGRGGRRRADQSCTGAQTRVHPGESAPGEPERTDSAGGVQHRHSSTGCPFPDSERRIAGVNSFGFGGTNAHVVLAEPPAPVSAGASDTSQQLPLALLPISARTEEALVATAGQLAEHLTAHRDVTLLDLGYTLGQRRSHLNYRSTLVAGSITDAQEQLQALADGGQIFAGRATAAVPKLAFVCTGMGPHWWKMCRGLLDAYPAFTESILRTDRELSQYTSWSLLDELRADETRSRMGETEVAQPANFAIQIALAEQLKRFGVNPDAVIGHSAGEVAAHYLAGVLTFEQAVYVIYHRSRLQQRTTGLGRMLAAGLSAELFMQTIDAGTLDDIGQRISIAAINSPSAVTVAGDSDALEKIARQLDEREIFNRFLTGKVPYHTHFMDVVKDDLYSAFEGLSPDAATLPLYSTVTGERLDGYADGAAYWWQNTRATVLFEPAVRRMLDDGYTRFIELGPHPVLAASLLEIAGTQKTDVLVAATQRRDDDDSRTLMTCVGALHCHGHPIAWDALYPRRRRGCSSFRCTLAIQAFLERNPGSGRGPALPPGASAVGAAGERDSSDLGSRVEHRRHTLSRGSRSSRKHSCTRRHVHRNGAGCSQSHVRVS